MNSAAGREQTTRWWLGFATHPGIWWCACGSMNACNNSESRGVRRLLNEAGLLGGVERFELADSLEHFGQRRLANLVLKLFLQPVKCANHAQSALFSLRLECQ